MENSKTSLFDLHFKVQELKERFNRLLETASQKGVITHSEYIWIRDGKKVD